jgi:2-hydroxychromene-2-carboxylate isomerase
MPQSPASEPVEFYFDFASPYGYLASTRIDEIAARHGRTVAWRPILLGAVFKITGMQANVMQPLRGDYLRHDAVRFARLLGVPLTVPEVMPLNAVVASRAFYWRRRDDPAGAHALAKALYHAHWAEGRDLTTADQVAEVAAGLALDRAAVLAGVQDPAVKEILRIETDGAICRGVFGAPFILVDGEPFWGADRLDQVDRWLAGRW